jgi:hypothetical protein
MFTTAKIVTAKISKKIETGGDGQERLYTGELLAGAGGSLVAAAGGW